MFIRRMPSRANPRIVSIAEIRSSRRTGAIAGSSLYVDALEPTGRAGIVATLISAPGPEERSGVNIGCTWAKAVQPGLLVGLKPGDHTPDVLFRNKVSPREIGCLVSGKRREFLLCTAAYMSPEQAKAKRTPVTLGLQPGQHAIGVVMKGYQNWLQQVTIEADATEQDGPADEVELAIALSMNWWFKAQLIHESGTP